MILYTYFIYIFYIIFIILMKTCDYLICSSEMTCSNHGTNTFENMRLPYLFASASICTYLINVIEPQ